jgi:hypothetical protein
VQWSAETLYLKKHCSNGSGTKITVVSAGQRLAYTLSMHRLTTGNQHQKMENRRMKLKYGKINVPQSTYVLDDKILGLVTTEYAIQAVELIINLVSESDVSTQSPVQMLQEIIQKADTLYETVVAMDEEGLEQEAFDFNVGEIIKILVESYASLLLGDMRPSSIEVMANSALKSDVTEKHPKRAVSTSDDTPTRKKIREDIYNAKVKQAERVNNAIMRKIEGVKKDPLKVNDICTLLLPPNIIP